MICNHYGSSSSIGNVGSFGSSTHVATAPRRMSSRALSLPQSRLRRRILASVASSGKSRGNSNPLTVNGSNSMATSSSSSSKGTATSGATSYHLSRPLDVLIIGGGIGGLTAAVALREAGVHVRVFEGRQKADSLTGPGGIQIQANAEKVLRLLSSPWPQVLDGSSSVSSSTTGGAATPPASTAVGGCGSSLSDAVYVVGGPIMSGGFRSMRGEYLYYSDVDSVGLHDIKSNGLSISRRSLQTILYSALPPLCVSFGRRFQSVIAPPEGEIGRIKVLFEDGGVEECDVLVGADGIRSKVREQFAGHSANLTYGGTVCWRGRLPMARIGRGADWLLKTINKDSWAEYWGKGVRIGMFTVGHEATPDESAPGGIRLEGEPQLAWYAFANRPETWGPESGSDEASRLREIFAGFASPVPELLAALEPSGVHMGKIMYQKPRPAPWARGRVTLLGDAAHAMLPTLGQGGCMAMEDALELANELGAAVAASATTQAPELQPPAMVASYDAATVRRLEAALRNYEASRAPRVTRVSEHSVQVADLAMAETDFTAWLRDTIYRLTPKWAGDKQFQYLFKDYMPAWKEGVRLHDSYSPRHSSRSRSQSPPPPP